MAASRDLAAQSVEQAQLDLPLPPDVTDEGFGSGLEYVLLQRAALGCKIDGGQYKIGGYTHEDAEVIAATVAGTPDSLGGKRMAIRVAELARAGLTPDWMPGAVPRCVPTIVTQNQAVICARPINVLYSKNGSPTQLDHQRLSPHYFQGSRNPRNYSLATHGLAHRNARTGTTIHCRTGVRPVPSPGRRGMASR